MSGKLSYGTFNEAKPKISEASGIKVNNVKKACPCAFIQIL
jgi:hypothetical protein